MKKLYIIILFSALIIGMFSCKDACDTINCNNHGTFDDGSCVCDDCYEGTSCEVEVNAKFLGEWVSPDYVCTGFDPNPVAFIIEKGDNIKELVLINADQQDIRLNAFIKR